MRPAPTCLALYCDREGHIAERIRDDLDLVPPPMATLLDAVVTEAQAEARVLLTRTWDEYTVAGHPLTLSVPGGAGLFHFTGSRLGDDLLLTAAPAVPPPPSRRRQEDVLYTELSRLNNQLVTMQREAVKQNAQLERVNGEKNRFIGMLVHDLRQPLWVINYFSDHMLKRPETPVGEYEKVLRLIYQSSDFMSSLLNDTLDLASIEAGQLRLDRTPTDLAHLIERAVAINVELARRKHIEIHYVPPVDLPLLNVDPIKVMQVLNNLLTNATKYSSSGSTIRVALGLEADSVLATVRDEGTGIPHNELKKLFRPFGTTSVRTPDGEKSTGLGLAICRRVVEGHGGRIWVDATGTNGTTFAFTLPRTEVKSQETSANASV